VIPKTVTFQAGFHRKIRIAEINNDDYAHTPAEYALIIRALAMSFQELEAECGKADDELEYYREAGRFHPRALKLMRKRKNFVVVAVDEPYFGAVYWMIRGHEMAKGTWTPDDEKVFQAAMVENVRLT